MPDLPAELTAALVVLAVAVLSVGALIVRGYGKLIAANLELVSAKRDHERTEVGNQSKLEALAVQMAENNARQNTALQDTITKLTTEFSRQTGEIAGQLKAEQQSRRVLEAKFEEVSDQKVQTSQQLYAVREALKATEAERDRLKAEITAMAIQLQDLPKLRAELETYRKQLETSGVEMLRQASEIRELKDRQAKRHEQINEWQAAEMERKVENDMLRGERDRLRLNEQKLQLEAASAREALAVANEHIKRMQLELDDLKRRVPLVAATDLSTLTSRSETLSEAGVNLAS